MMLTVKNKLLSTPAGSRICDLLEFIGTTPREATHASIRQPLETCMPGGIALGSGNTVANYVPLDNYLVVLEEASS